VKKKKEEKTRNGTQVQVLLGACFSKKKKRKGGP
jgi:hypothetical protein